jgi:hypothetical protein
MLRSKINKIFSETKDFFTSSEKAVSKTMSVYKAINISQIKFERKNNWPEQYSRADIFLTLLLQPLFSVKNIEEYLTSSLYAYLEAAKDTLYRFKKDSDIDWRKLCNHINKKILEKIKKSGTVDTGTPSCLIIDDTDLAKTGKHIEHISRIWSHVAHRSLLGFKGLFLGYWDSKSFIGLDLSLHKEKGKNKKYPFGLKKTELQSQYKKQRVKDSFGSEREEELMTNKISNAIAMIKRAVKNKVEFEYLLVDSWFFCEKMIQTAIEYKSHIIGMCKIGKAKYIYDGKNKSAKQIIDDLRKKKEIKWNKSLGLFVAGTVVEYKGIKLKLFFCKNTKRGKWHLLATTNTKLAIKKTYEIYSIRWSIEVFFKEAKQLFELGNSQCRDFDSQIADTTICMLQYNIFSLAKRFGSYETLGELFRESKESIIELTICKRLWGFLLELINIIADLFDIDPDELIEKILTCENTDNKYVKLMRLIELDAA